MEYMSANFDMLLADAATKGDEAVNFLDELEATYPGKFIIIKKKYFEKYFPELLPKAAPKKPTMRDKINALKNKE